MGAAVREAVGGLVRRSFPNEEGAFVGGTCGVEGVASVGKGITVSGSFVMCRKKGGWSGQEGVPLPLSSLG